MEENEQPPPQPTEESPPYFYINPSTSNLCITNSGLLIDGCPGKTLGLWDPLTGKCVKLFQNTISGIFYKLNYLNRSDQVILADEKCLKLFNYHTETITKVIKINMFLDQIIDHINPNYILGINSGNLFLWDLETGDLIKKLNTGNKSRCAIRLENGNYLTRNNNGDIYSIKSDLSTNELISIQGAVYSFCQLSNNEFALGRNQSIHIMEAEKNSICSILKGYDEIYLSLLDFADGKIISGSNKATLRIWDIKTAKCLKVFGLKEDVKYLELNWIRDSNKIISSNQESKKVRVWDLGKIDDPNDIPVSMKFFEGELSNIQKILKLDGDNIAILCYAQYFDGQLIFLQEIRIFNYKLNSFIKKKQINRASYIVEASSMLSVFEGKALLYLTKGASIEKDVLHLWEYNVDQDLTYDYNVEKSPLNFFFKFERILIPFSLSYYYTPPPPPNLVSKVEPKGVSIKGPSGINVYDFTVKSIFKIEFEVEFMANACEMIDKDKLIFVNSKNQMEWWNIKDKKILKKIECNPNIFNSIKFSKKILFMTTTSSEIIIWDSESLGCLQKRKKNVDREILKIDTINYEVFVLYSDGILEKWDFRKNDIKQNKIKFAIKDFFIDKNLFLLGEVLIEEVEISKSF